MKDGMKEEKDRKEEIKEEQWKNKINIQILIIPGQWIQVGWQKVLTVIYLV